VPQWHQNQFIRSVGRKGALPRRIELLPQKKTGHFLFFPFSSIPENLIVERSFPSKLLRNFALSFRLFRLFDLPNRRIKFISFGIHRPERNKNKIFPTKISLLFCMAFEKTLFGCFILPFIYRLPVCNLLNEIN
jgi:hypothetical protein